MSTRKKKDAVEKEEEFPRWRKQFILERPLASEPYMVSFPMCMTGPVDDSCTNPVKSREKTANVVSSSSTSSLLL